MRRALYSYVGSLRLIDISLLLRYEIIDRHPLLTSQQLFSCLSRADLFPVLQWIFPTIWPLETPLPPRVDCCLLTRGGRVCGGWGNAACRSPCCLRTGTARPGPGRDLPTPESHARMSVGCGSTETVVCEITHTTNGKKVGECLCVKAPHYCKEAGWMFVYESTPPL